jgi:hypothetical protein
MAAGNKDNSPTDSLREITWDIGTAELQRSVMAQETFDLMCVGIRHPEKIRSRIRQKRGRWVRRAHGNWTQNPSERFVNEHAWVLSEGDMWKLWEHDKGKEAYTLLPNAEQKLPAFLEYLRRQGEPRIWRPGPMT